MKVLFVCVHNSARSQMAEAFLNRLGSDKFIAESAGIEPSSLNPLVVQVMAEAGYDLSNNKCDSVFKFFQENRQYDLVIKVCDQVNGQRCPVFPMTKAVLNWSFPDPAEFDGTPDEKLQKTREIRDLIKTRIEEFIRVFGE